MVNGIFYTVNPSSVFFHLMITFDEKYSRKLYLERS